MDEQQEIENREPEAPEQTEAEPTPEKTAPPWLHSPPQVRQYPSPEAMAKAAATRFLETAKRAVEKQERFTVVLAGGGTPRLLYQLLAKPPYRDKVPWNKTFFVFGDERCVPPDDETSNYRLAKKNLFEPLEIPDYRILRMKGEQPPADAARWYEVRLSDLFLGKAKRKFDLVLLGIGEDGHTASLFPGTEALEEQERWVVANHVPQIEAWRLTMTFKALSATKRVIFMATGEAKAKVLAEAFGGVEHETRYPCERITPYGARREVLLDRAAAALIPRENPGTEEPES
jgi:6-phosphogluconolactonase